jgi:AraC-like DNA-binding protein
MIDQISFAGDGMLSSDQLPDVMLVWVHAGKVVYRSGDDARAATRGDVRLFGSGRRALSLRVTDARFTAVHLIQPSHPDQPEATPACLAPRSEAASDMLKRTIAYANDIVNTGDEVATEVMSDVLAEVLRAAVRAGFVPQPGQDGAGIRSGHPAALQQAVEYIEANAARRVTIADLAAEIYATPRTVQYLFRRHLGTTPTAYLRRVRLSKARQELLTGNRTVTTVTATATRWGFAHTGRFAVLYREIYGESPHQTLAR